MSTTYKKRIRLRIALVALAVIPVLMILGCSTLTGSAASAADLSQYEPQLTVGVPKEKPQQPIRRDHLTKQELNDITIYHNSIRAVVNITALSVSRRALGKKVPMMGTGSGFIFDESGYVLTNNHVVHGAQSLIVTLYDGSNYRATIVGTDSELDLAVLKFDPQGRKLTTLSFADSGQLQIGQHVLALGNPFGLEGTLTSGIVSGLSRPMQTEAGFIVRDLIQTDAAINPGNSGGPLMDSSGEVIGVDVSILSPSGGNIGIGFAIPSNIARRDAEDIIKYGHVQRGWIQIDGVGLDPVLAQAAGVPGKQGLLITQVVPGGNADRAGLRGGKGGQYVERGSFMIPLDGDIIVAMDGHQITSAADYLGSLESTRPGEKVELTILRNDHTMTVPVVLTAPPS